MGTFFTLLICLVVLLVVLAALSVKIVNQQSAVIVERLGRFNRVLYPGINFIIPIIEQVRGILYLYIQNLEFQIVAITSDKVTITLDTSLVYHIKPDKVAEAFYAIGNPNAVIKSTIENSIRSYVANFTHEEILKKRDELTQYLVDHLTEKFDQWGRDIDAFQIKDVVLPAEITEAMAKVIASKRLQEAATFEAEAAKTMKIKAAEAEREARVLAGKGVAEERQAIIEGLKKSMEDMHAATGVEMDEVMNVVMLTQYIDALKAIGEGTNAKVVFLNTSPKSLDELAQNIAGFVETTKGSN